jgi:hypothetical protein
LPRLTSNSDLLASTSQVAGMTGMYHHAQLFSLINYWKWVSIVKHGLYLKVINYSQNGPEQITVLVLSPSTCIFIFSTNLVLLLSLSNYVMWKLVSIFTATCILSV